MTRNKLIILVVVVCLVVFVLAIRDNARDPKNVRSKEAADQRNSVSEIVDYGNDVYYFPRTEDNFGNALSAFIARHPDLEVIASVGNGTGLHGLDKGYFVIFRKKM